MAQHAKRIGIALAVILAAAVGAGPAHPAVAQDRPSPATDKPRNIVLFIADGGGPASFTMARDFVRWRDGREALAFDSLLVGTIRTFSSDSRVTDSGAGATAFSAGVKTYNGAIAVDADKRPVATVLQGAERRQMATGLVATSRMTHATPASFAAHVSDRWMEDEIASQLILSGADVLVGGGMQHFHPDTSFNADSRAPSGVRPDGRDLIKESRALDYRIVLNRGGLLDATHTPLLAPLAMSHLDYEIDRDSTEQPSLAEMTIKAIELLEGVSDKGFFLMVEGSRIDHAAHDNDAAAHLHDVIAYEKAFAAALDFARRDGRTLVLATSDHETGGLTLGRDGTYAWYPDVLARVKASQGKIIEAIQSRPSHAADVIKEMAGLDSLSTRELEQIAVVREESGESVRFNSLLRDIISERALVGWTSGGHTAVDVNVYAYGPGSKHFRGNRDNTYIGRTLADLLDLSLEALTSDVRNALAISSDLEIVGHRGARGLLPENTLPSFRRAMELGVNTLEIDIVATADGQVVVSHEPWMHHIICMTPDGRPIEEEEERSFNLFQMTYDEVARFDCGTPGHPDFPEQKPISVRKPLLREVIELGEQFARASGRPPVRYNIEIKSRPEWDGVDTPTPEEFMPDVYDIIVDAGVRNRTIIQSFDPRPLRVMHGIDSSLYYALLVSGTDEDTLEENLDDLGFTPDGYNPNYGLVSTELLEAAHARGMEVVPWTVNEMDEMERLITLGVDGLITDYPDRARAVLRRLQLLP